ncbi:hypothetical protein [Pareuzebyella sediminis]|uniref:hypothetical protein n=1 Tax=Pareuzebyella sediminis TaxID=2607998 RepID=UPI0011EF9B8A|nr:hypothetical protein [Pareuzebyella sediminis]
MKRLLSLLAIVGIILVSNCSRIPENNDEVIGIWSDIEMESTSLTAKQETFRQEWIFNDAYLGRYHQKSNGKIIFKTDFRWSREGENYIISYPGTDMNNQIVSMQDSKEGIALADAHGNVLAVRE